MDAISKRPLAPPKGIDESNIDVVEGELIVRASGTIRMLESALAAWDSSERKPEELKESYAGYRQILERLSAWERRMLLARGKEGPLDERLGRLRDYVEIYYSYRVIG